MRGREARVPAMHVPPLPRRLSAALCLTCQNIEFSSCNPSIKEWFIWPFVYVWKMHKKKFIK